MEEHKNNETKSQGDLKKVLAIIGYIFPFLFFIPLVLEETKKDHYAKFHANQQLNLLIYWVAGWIVVSILSVIFAVTIILIPLIFILGLAYQIAGIVFAVLGIVYSARGEAKALPLIGKFQLIK